MKAEVPDTLYATDALEEAHLEGKNDASNKINIGSLYTSTDSSYININQ